MYSKTLLIGVGNAGNQIANLMIKRYHTLADAIYINTSDADLSMVDGGTKIKIGSHDDAEGSGKNRSKTKLYLKDDISKLLQDEGFLEYMEYKKYVFIISSTAGGTGSGTAPVLMSILKACFPDVNFILVAILPNIQASLMEQGNTIEFLNELYQDLGDDITYMIYDNETTSDCSPTESLEVVNDAVVEDIKVLSGVDNYPTPYDSIDEADMESIITTPGRLLVTRIHKGLTEKNLEDSDVGAMISKSIKQSCHAETDRNKKVVRWGIITYLTEDTNKLYTPNLQKLHDFIGTPIERFNHHAINDKHEGLNFIHLIASGLSPINDRVKKINDRILELKNALATDAASKYILSGESVSYDATAQRKKEERRLNEDVDVDTLSLFNKFIK